MKRSAFTFIEVLLVVGVIAAIGGLSAPTYRNYQIRSDLYLAEDVVLQGLYRARLLSQAGEGDDEWRYNIAEGIVYKGGSFATRDSVLDETFALPDSVIATGIQEVAFGRIHGAPSPDGDIVLQALNGEKRWIPISPDTVITGNEVPPVQFKVRFDDIRTDDGMVTFCHKPGTSAEETKTLPQQAWNGHQNHGDHLGLCVSDGGEQTEVLNVVYVGENATPYYEGQWIPLTENGAAVVDGMPTFTEIGLYVRGQADHMQVDSGSFSSAANGESPYGAENPFNGSVSDDTDGDEVTMGHSNTSVLYQAREGSGRDTVLLYWSDTQ